MAEKLYHLVNGEFVFCGMPSVHIPTYAEIGAHIAILNDVGFFDDHSVAEPVCFDGISDGKRNTEKQASLYDAMMAEMIDDRNAEKAKVRNRRRADRKHKLLPKERKHREEMRKDRMYGYYFNENCPKVMFAPDSLPIKTRKYAEGDRIDMADWEKDLRDLKNDISYAEFDVETSREDLHYFNAEIQNIEYQLSDMEMLRDRLETLRKSREEAEGYLRNSEEFLRKYAYVREMI